MPNTFTLTGTMKDSNNNAVYVGKYVHFRVTSVGTDVDTSFTYPRHGRSFVVGSDGTLSPALTGETMEMWVNGDSGVQSYYEIKLPSRQKVDVVIPSSVDGTTVDLATIIELYQVSSTTQQSTTLSEALEYTDALAADPSTNTSFSASAWKSDLDLEIGTDVQAYDAGLDDISGLTPTDSYFIVGDGSNWVAETGTTARTSIGLPSFSEPFGDPAIANNGVISIGHTDGSTCNIKTDGSTPLITLRCADILLNGNTYITGGFRTLLNTVTSTSYSVATTDSIILADDDTAGSAMTITLVAAATAGSGFHLTIKKKGSTANVIIDGNASETIDGALTATLTTQYESITIISDGSNWNII